MFSTHTPADDRRFDGAACLHALPNAATPSTEKGNDVRTDVILAKELKWLVARRHTIVSECINSLLTCCHAIVIVRVALIAAL